ncbi:hypothetical protein GCM10023226_38730 [Nocardioides nanhaiensis]|uniref:Uncharacterized protein n=1 Tax=Nocardioides nanhaiensis TaxID=1476871 RepID=A0ABP8WX96_9ACTN
MVCDDGVLDRVRRQGMGAAGGRIGSTVVWGNSHAARHPTEHSASGGAGVVIAVVGVERSSEARGEARRARGELDGKIVT